MNNEEVNGFKLRVDNASMRLPGQVLRLDLYRLISYFHASEMLANLSDGDDFCPWQSLRDEFETPEIIRILLQTAVSIRFMAQGNGDDTRSADKAEREEVGVLFKVAGGSVSHPLTLQEACNKIIHAKNIVLDTNGDGNPYREFLKPRVFCFEEFTKKSGWEAEVNVIQFVEAASSIASLFS
jgi:hypothetical protein